MENEKSTPEFDPFETERPRGGRTAGWMAAFALLVALVVAGWSGWTWWQAREDSGAEARLADSLARVDSEQARLATLQREQARRLEAVERLELETGLTRLDEAIEQARGVAGSDRARLAGMESTLAELQSQLGALESRVAALVVRGESPRKGLELAEVDYLLRSANERLRLFGDARSAGLALELADAQLAAMDDPVYLPVRQAIAAARLSLDEAPRPDTIGLTQTLERLQASVPALPFPGEVTVATASGDLDTVDDPGVWARFKAAMGDLVSVRRRAAEEAVISLEDKDYLRQGLWLQLEAARLALLREDPATWNSALGRARSTLGTHFDGDAAAVERFAAGLDRLEDSPLAVEWPDISEPWTRLQSIRRPADPAPNTAPEARDEPAAAEADAPETGPGEADPAAPTSSGEEQVSDPTEASDGTTGATDEAPEEEEVPPTNPDDAGDDE